jgi:hypothetical protein
MSQSINEIYMDVPAVRSMSRTLTDIGSVMKAVSTALEIAINALRAAALISFGGTAAAAEFMARIKPIVDHIAEKCTELGSDLEASVNAYEQGDALGSTKFH